MFDRFVFPHLEQLTALAHRHGKKYMYTMETGGLTLGPHLADAGVDVLYGVDPILDKLSLEQVRDKLCDRLTVVGGTHSMTLASQDTDRIRDEVRRAIDVLGPTNRFVLHPLDSLFPDTPWESVLCLIETWKKYTH
jgi:uroporphyrinogen-III decarboxylase